MSTGKLPTHPTVEQFNTEYQNFTQNTYKAFGQLMVRAWTDPNYAAQLKADPAGEMRKAGIPLPANYVINPDQFVMIDKPVNVAVEALHVQATGPAGAKLARPMMEKISCAGSASSFSCPSCTASTAGSGGC